MYVLFTKYSFVFGNENAFEKVKQDVLCVAVDARSVLGTLNSVSFVCCAWDSRATVLCFASTGDQFIVIVSISIVSKNI